ncbi:unnamed protein product [Chrysodeixis includens]|uniref:Uncharacterized protein n=1 Tax=Chrysodeixis includens TaxID=689277 RepID=A0A9N8Q1J2_CHRIL|nr:unnamed protein product [Chrysodeixis includens]
MVFYEKYRRRAREVADWSACRCSRRRRIWANNLEKCSIMTSPPADTGGFSVAVFLRSLALYRGRRREAARRRRRAQKRRRSRPRRREGWAGYREDPLCSFSGDKEEVFPSIKEFYDLNVDFDSTCS